MMNIDTDKIKELKEATLDSIYELNDQIDELLERIEGLRGENYDLTTKIEELYVIKSDFDSIENEFIDWWNEQNKRKIGDLTSAERALYWAGQDLVEPK
jgi:uncharacterized coiled-coil DUF342 family protein